MTAGLTPAVSAVEVTRKNGAPRLSARPGRSARMSQSRNVMTSGLVSPREMTV
jgi:hypothetical protein